MIGYDASLFQAIDSTTFRALTPRTGDIEFNVNVDNRLSLQESVRIPLVTVPQASFTETDYDGGWEVVLSSNGDQDSPPPTTAPTTGWDGSEGSCKAKNRKASTGTAFQEWQLRFCARSYAVNGVPDSLISGTHVTVAPIWRDASGAQVGAGCDEHHCITSLQVELYDDIGELVGRSSLIGVGGSAARLPIGLGGIRPAVVPNGAQRRGSDSARPAAASANKAARLPLSPERAP